MKSFISAVAVAVLSQQISAAPVSTTGTIIDPLVFDGRIPAGYRSYMFDNGTTSSYNPAYVLGSEPWSKVIHFPNVEDSLFDKAMNAKSLTVTLNDKSVFAPGGPQNSQYGFRRSELLPNVNTGNDITNNGVTAVHFSVRFDPTRPLNYSHEYQPVFIETQDYSSHIWTLKTGTIFGEKYDESVSKSLRILSSTSSVRPETTLFSVPFVRGWHNFAIETDWDNSIITVYYSFGQDDLVKVAGPVPNDSTGKGEAHFGLLKLPTGAAGIDVVHQGYQENHINEGLTYGGIFIEKVSATAVTLKPRV